MKDISSVHAAVCIYKIIASDLSRYTKPGEQIIKAIELLCTRCLALIITGKLDPMSEQVSRFSKDAHNK